MQPTQFNLSIGIIKISSVENASAVNIGKNLLLDWDSHSKTNQGLGKVSGDNNILDKIANQVEDPDKVDLLSQPQSLSPKQGELKDLVKIFFKEEL